MKTLPNQDIEAESVPYFDERGEPFRKRFNMANMIIIFNQFSGAGALGAFACIVFPKVVGG